MACFLSDVSMSRRHIQNGYNILKRDVRCFHVTPTQNAIIRLYYIERE